MTNAEIIHELKAFIKVYNQATGAEPVWFWRSIKAIRELDRFQNITIHCMSTSWEDHIFIYTERDGKCTIAVYKDDKLVKEYSVRPLHKGSLETWAICWMVNQREEENR